MSVSSEDSFPSGATLILPFKSSTSGSGDLDWSAEVGAKAQTLLSIFLSFFLTLRFRQGCIPFRNLPQRQFLLQFQLQVLQPTPGQFS
jgi:hypothetical protein